MSTRTDLLQQACLLKQTLIDRLLDDSCPSIQYRLLTEIVPEYTASSERIDGLYERLLRDEEVAHIRQQPLGFITQRDAHSEHGLETYIRFLSEKGVRPDHPALSAMLEYVHEHPDVFGTGSLRKVGRYLDTLNLGGSSMIRAVLLSQCGMEHSPLVRSEVEKALQAFDHAAGVEHWEEIGTTIRGKAILKKGAGWPSVYHYRLLAYTRSWRTESQMDIVAEAIRNILRLSPIPDWKGVWNGQVIAPGSFAVADMDRDYRRLSRPPDWMTWLHRMELMARMGVVSKVHFFRHQLAEVVESRLLSDKLPDTIKSHPYFTRWSPYTGLRLEPSWRCRCCKERDIRFRLVLIIHYGLVQFSNPIMIRRNPP